jgi:hypothetical protein
VASETSLVVSLSVFLALQSQSAKKKGRNLFRPGEG